MTEKKCHAGVSYGRCFIIQLNLAEVILTGLPTSIFKEGSEAKTYTALPKSPQAGLPSPTPHRVNGTVSPRQVQVHESIGLGQETVEGLRRKNGGAVAEGVIEPHHPWATEQRSQALKPEHTSAGA